MTENIQYKIAVPETYEKDGEEKTAWTTVGTAFANDSGNITLELPAHVAVSGRVVLFPKKNEPEDKE
ncbi:hypothetical protein ACTRXD_00490 [Nitrospira sp. T9]|uniref:hypothetical protein n=1 Tax=unclassified Nitrospira TaxID=2652172 RepID=UPI003F9ADCA1